MSDYLDPSQGPVWESAQKAPTLAASTILAVASARILAALKSLREFSRSLSPTSALMAFTRSGGGLGRDASLSHHLT